MALTKTPGQENGWEIGRWDVPVRRGGADGLVSEPGLYGGFASYTRFPDGGGPSMDWQLQQDGMEDVKGVLSVKVMG